MSESWLLDDFEAALKQLVFHLMKLVELYYTVVRLFLVEGEGHEVNQAFGRTEAASCAGG